MNETEETYYSKVHMRLDVSTRGYELINDRELK
jgi:hypothetical protein